MGVALGVRRYIGGKTPAVFFSERVWPESRRLLLKLGLDRTKAQALFAVFSRIDAEATGKVSRQQCLDFFGGRRTRFTERVFEATRELSLEEGSFVQFAVCVWSFCTMSHSLLARYVWEIFDVDRRLRLERADVQAMYRMLYDCEEHDPAQVDRLPFEASDSVDRQTFVSFVSSRRHLLQPAIDYRNRLRARTGGRGRWEVVAAYRRRWFAGIDEEASSLEEALVAIVQSEDRNAHPEEPVDADAMLRRQRLRVTANEERRTSVHLARLGSLHFSSPLAEKGDPEVEEVWAELEDQLASNEGRQFSTDEVWEFSQLREQMYALFDRAVQRVEELCEARDRTDLELTIGVPEDHVLRTDDYLETAEGRSEFNRLFIMRMLRTLLDEAQKQNQQATRVVRTDKELDLAAALIEMGKVMKGVEKRQKERDEAVAAGVQLVSIKEQVGISEAVEIRMLRLVSRYATKDQERRGKEKTKGELIELVRNRAIESIKLELKERKLRRSSNHVLRLQNIERLWGVRGSRWFLVIDKTTEREVLMNVDTLQVVKANTAICEKCDAILKKSELHCGNCDAPRSKANFRFFNELGNDMYF